MDWRNFGSWLTEKLRLKVEWARYLVDIRIGFKRNGVWKSEFHVWTPVTQNFWNGLFTANIYLVKSVLWSRVSVLIPRINVVIRFAHDYWFEAGIGYLFDRGEFGAKMVIMNWQKEEIYNSGCNAKGWEEGAV